MQIISDQIKKLTDDIEKYAVTITIQLGVIIIIGIIALKHFW